MKLSYLPKTILLLTLLLGCGLSMRAQTTTFNYSPPGGVQTYTVPAGVTSLGIDAKGGCGGGAYVSTSASGPVSLGGRVQCTLNVTPGDVLNIYVGAGVTAMSTGANNPGGYNGGGQGGTYANAGGGATDIRIGGTALSNRVVVAGGGGGGGDFGPLGGAGGGTTGGSGAGPSGSACGGGPSGPACSTGNALGMLGQGAPISTTVYALGGGGGGNWGGNQGTVSYGSGGGGSSYTHPTLCTGVVHTQGYSGANGNGQVIITQLCVNPAPNTGGASTLCTGQSVTFSNPGTTGTWSSSSSAVSVNPTTGAVLGVSGGTANISYIVPGGCTAISPITVNVGPTVTGISNNGPICSNVGLSLNLNATGAANVTGYSWTGPGVISGATTASASVPSASTSATGIYSLTLSSASGCVAVYTTSATVNLGPTPIGGSANACQTQPLTLTNTVSGGTWTSSISGVASINPSTGALTPVALGTTTISYALANGCAVGRVETVNPLPALTVTPSSATICLNDGAPITASSTGATFAWTGLTASEISCTSCGSTIITPSTVGSNSYSVTATNSLGCSTMSSITLNVNPVPSPVSGLTNVCVGTSTTLSSSTGGTWTSSDPSKVTIVPSTGVITGMGVGTATVSYTLSTGCKSTAGINVAPSPANIGGSTSVCVGQTITLTHAVPGGIWTSSASGTASVNVSGGVTGVATGAATITYTLPSGCTTTIPMVVNPLPTPITGNTAICQGTTSTLSSTPTGGTWSSNTPAIASVNAFGVASGVVPGFALISYTLPTGCMVSTPVTVNLAPSAITGVASVCFAAQTALSNGTAGGGWTSGNTGIATVNTTGVVTGIAAGNATITYAMSTGCNVTKIVTVNPLPSTIMGATELCQNATSSLSSADGGGSWATSFAGIASVDASGLVTGVGAGNATITYTLPTGCRRTTSVTIDPLPGAITGNMSICENATTTLSDFTSGGTWSSASIAAGVDGAGIVTAYSAGYATIIYTLPTGCSRSATVTVNTLPAAISGTASVCSGSTTSLSNATTGGVWTSNNYSIGSIDASGMVTGGNAGIAQITYTLPTGCNATAAVTVNALPSNISGTASVCAGLTSTLHNGTPSGSWSSESPLIATINAAGVVTGQSAGVATITYTGLNGCYKTRAMTVNPSPAAIGGVLSVCNGLSTSLSNSVGGGTWQSSFPGVATVDASGMVNANIAGNTNVTYTLPQGCMAVATVTVNPLPADITGNMTVCQGSSVMLSSATAGGTWGNAGTGNTSVSATGVVTGLLPGTEAIMYTLPTGCSKTANVVVNAVPAPIAGNMFTCRGTASALSSATTGGAWSSSNSAIASVNASGMVTGVATGVATITYKVSTTCMTTGTFIVNALPAPITGTAAVCPGTSSTLVDANTGGNWTTADPGTAMVDAFAGTVTGISAGTVAVTYTLPTGCMAVKTVTVNPMPAAISGNNTICQGTTTGLSNPSAGGTWSSSSTGVATISTSGLVIGLAPGNTVITYTLPTGCYNTSSIMVNPAPGPITGTAAVCPGTMSTLSNITPGGIWGTPSSNATITLAGNVTGVNAGTAVVSYLLPTGCVRTRTVTINPLPAAITGTAVVCPGTSAMLSNDIAGGSWSSHQPLIATVDASGMVSGVAEGMTTVTYTLPTGCYATKSTVVNPAVAEISGSTSICKGTTATLTTASVGGIWTSNNTTIATVGPVSGVVSGMNAGAVMLTYTLATGCMATYNMNINAAPSAIIGASNICMGSTTALSNTEAAGTWSSSAPGTATISASGMVSAIAPGTTMITYTLPSGCSISSVFEVNAMPAPNAVTGGGTICAGAAGVGIGTDGSTLGTVYRLSRGSLQVASMTGTGGTIDFGAFTTPGTYTMTAVTPAGCMANMAGSAVVNVMPAVVPSVFVASSVGDSTCSGTAATFSATASNGGSTPTYQWSVNGAPVAGSSSYTYTPADGDLVTAVLTSNAGCATPATASAGITMHVISSVMPSVAISVGPGNSVCKGTAANFMATGTNGGSNPQYTWYRNGFVYTEGSSFTYTPEDGDVITLKMESNYRCVSANNVSSNAITMTVNNIYTPTVQITANPGTDVQAGQMVNFTTTVGNAGPTPTYQWKVRGAAVPGATGATFSSNKLNDGDVVTCEVTGTGACGVKSANSVTMHISTGVAHTGSANSNVRLMPNPNNGTFTIAGTTGAASDEEIMITVTDMLGQVVYRNTTTALNGNINAQVQLGNTLANGMYLLNMSSAAGQQAFSFMIAR